MNDHINNSRAAAAFIEKMNMTDQIRLLIWLAHHLSTHARAFYEENKVIAARGVTQLGAVNECENRILGYVLSKLRGVETYPVNVLIEGVFAQAVSAGIDPQRLHDEIVKQVPSS